MSGQFIPGPHSGPAPAMSPEQFAAQARGYESIYAPALEVVQPRPDAYQVVYSQPHDGPAQPSAVQGVSVVSDTGEQRNLTLTQGLNYVAADFYDSLHDSKPFKALEQAGAVRVNPPGVHQTVREFSQVSVMKWAGLLWRGRREDQAAEDALRAYLPALPTSDLRVALMRWLEERAKEAQYAAPPRAPVFDAPVGTAVADHAAGLGLSLSYGQRQV